MSIVYDATFKQCRFYLGKFVGVLYWNFHLFDLLHILEMLFHKIFVEKPIAGGGAKTDWKENRKVVST